MGKRPPVCVHAAVFVARFLTALALPLPHVWGLPWLVKQGNWGKELRLTGSVQDP